MHYIMLQEQSYIHDIRNTRRQDQMIDFHPHTASTHITQEMNTHLETLI
jgi:hypothetical protein